MEVAGLTKEKIFEIVIHTIAWGLLFCSPFLFAYGDNASVSVSYTHLTLPTICSV